MAYYFLFPESDTTLYSHPNRKELNTGADEILEILKEKGNDDDILYPSRVILKFKNDELKSTISNVIGHSKFQSTKVNLQLMSSQAQNVASTIVLETFLSNFSSTISFTIHPALLIRTDPKKNKII